MKLIYLILLLIILIGTFRVSEKLMYKKVSHLVTETYNQGYVNGRQDALSEAVVCYGAVIPGTININYPCEE